MDILNFKSEYPFAANTYVISSNGEFAVIDPAASPLGILASLQASAKDFRYIILTHGHFDHTLFIEEWQNETGLPVTVSTKDAEMIRDPFLNCYQIFFGKNRAFFGKITTVKDGDVLPLGDTSLVIHESPGHTPGSILIEEGNVLFTGDTVFANEGYGRCDLPGGDFEELKKSIRKIHLFTPDTEVYPGHGEKTTVSKIIRL